MVFRTLFCGGVLTAGMLLGCTTPVESAIQPSPTAVFTATPTIPPSLTPTPTLVASPTAVTGTSTFTPSPHDAFITPPFTPSPSPTPDVIPDFLFLAEVQAPFLETPPLTTDCDGSGEVFESQFPSQTDGPRTYHVYLPPCYGQDGRSYPVLYLFHGSVQTSAHWLELGLARYADEGIQSGDYPPFIAIMPFNGDEGNLTSGGDFSPEGITINELIPYVDNHYCTWAEAAGRGIGGISRGGYWALMMAFRHEELFSAVSGHSSHLKLETDIALYNPLGTYATADLSTMRIWLDRGQHDFLWRGQDRLHSLLTEAGIAHEYHINGGGHNEVYWLIHIKEYLNWHTAVWSPDRTTYPACRV